MGDLINTLETPGEFDALASLRPGEPYFVLVGRDRFAPDRIRDWADLNRKRALVEFADDKIDAEERDRELRKSTQAELIAEAMVEYKNKWTASPPQIASTRPSYSGHELPEETRLRDQLQSARARAAAALHNAISEMDDLNKLIPTDEGHDATLALSSMAARVAPKRPI